MMAATVAFLAGFVTLSVCWPPMPADSTTEIGIGGTTGSRAVVVALALSAVGAVVFEAPILVIGSVLVAAVLADDRRRRRRRAVSAAARASLVAWLDHVLRSVRRGHALSAAVVEASSADTVDVAWAETVSRSLAAGRSVAEALRLGADEHRVNVPELELIAVTLEVLTVSGGAVGPALERVGDAVRHRSVAAADRRTQAQQALSSSLVMVLLPVVFAVGAAAVQPALVDVYLRSMLGGTCVVAGGLLTWLGWRWSSRVIDGRSP